MPFRLTDRHITDYYHHGYTIFRAILPASLVTELRVAGEEVHELAKNIRGPQVERSQTLGQAWDDLSPQARRAFTDYAELPALVEAMQRVLSPRHQAVDLAGLAIFFGTRGGPVVQDWHRDINEGSVGIDAEELARLKTDPAFFTQVNCALYTDTCLWYVPGSAGRPNTPGELEAAGPPYNGVEGHGRLLNPDLEGQPDAQREQTCLAYCRGMPGAANVVLEAGDFCLYRPIGWHTGNYAPYRKRLTLHHHSPNPELKAWQEQWYQRLSEQRQVSVT